MNRKDFSKPFFMSGPAESGWGGGPPFRGGPPRSGGGGGGWGSFNSQEPWNRYNEAYGNYQGGYGPGRGYSPIGPRPQLPLGGPRFGFRPHGPPLGFGGPQGGFGRPSGGPPGRMPKHSPYKFLIRCGVAPETISDLPREVMRNYLPNHCGVCKMNFDNFAFARLHYCSKNHLKNQKKWLLESTGGGNPKEPPLKSRDLYCELCDVQITSKQHADSHYAGKPHKAVVEGRKPPKNASLLKPGTQPRLEQLIRREKKFLKADSAVGSATAGANPSGKKPIVHEFYCEICKSAMTCSEQFTIHLNGKRHLAKEKQHILQMMKTPLDENAKDADPATDGANGGAGEDADEDADADAVDDADAGVEDTAMEKSNGNGVNDVEEDEEAAEGEQQEEAAGDSDDEMAEAVEDDSWVHGTGDGWDQPKQQEG